MFCIVFNCLETDVLHHYNLEAFYRKLSNGSEYRLRFAGLFNDVESEDVNNPPMTKEEYRQFARRSMPSAQEILKRIRQQEKSSSH